MIQPEQIRGTEDTVSFSIVDASLHDSYVRAARTSTINAVPYTQSEPFCRYVIQTDSPYIITNSLSDVPNGTGGYNNTGIVVDGVNYGNGQNVTENGVIKSFLYPLAAGTKTIQMVMGPTNYLVIGVPPERSVPMMSYELAPGSSHVVIAPSAPSKRIVVMSDSLSVGYAPTALPNFASVFQAWPVLMRVNALASGSGTFAGASLINAGYGGNRWDDLDGTAPKITASLANMALWLDGTSANILIAQLGTNDWGSGISAATLQTNLGTWLDAFNVEHPTVNVVLVTPCTRANENTPNAGGSTLPQIRTAIGTVQAARSSYCSLVSGPNLVTFPTNFLSDQIHLNTAGMIQFEANLRAAMGIY